MSLGNYLNISKINGNVQQGGLHRSIKTKLTKTPYPQGGNITTWGNMSMPGCF